MAMLNLNRLRLNPKPKAFPAGCILWVRKGKPTRIAPGGLRNLGYPRAGARVQQQRREFQAA